MKTYERILLENKAWAEEKEKLNPGYFEKLNKINFPKIMWIGSTDSIVEINEITNTDPGEIIAYRNLANLVKEDCGSFMTVLRYALYRDKIDHIIICGHNHCGGIREVLKGEPRDIVGDWLNEVNDLYQEHIVEFTGLDESEKELYLAELNVRQQIKKLTEFEDIKKLWKAEKRPKLHGWVYNNLNGLIKSILEIEPENIRQEKEENQQIKTQ